MKFNAGQVVMTRGVNEWQAENGLMLALMNILHMHQTGDWGDVCDEDKKANDFAVEHGERILSEYSLIGKRVWIITEWDRSVTTILFPEEY